MRKRCLLAFTFCFSLLSLCACGGVLPRTATLSPFSADLSFEQNGTVFEGAFLMEDADTMQFILRTPQELCGLQFSFEAGEAALRFGEAAVSLADACALSLPTAAPCALFEALCALAASPPQLAADLRAETPTSRGTATVVFSPESLLPQRVQLGDVVFTFENTAPIVT